MSKAKANSESSGLKRGEEKYTLLTNIREVGFGDVRLFCQAVLLSETSGSVIGPHWSIRGFGTEAAWHNFMIHLRPDAFPYTLTPFVNPDYLMLKDDGEAYPIFTGNLLTLQDGTEFKLYASDSKRPLDIHVSTDGDITKVWEILAEKTRLYWDAPYMPSLTYAPAKIRARNFI